MVDAVPQPVFADVDTGVDDAMALVYLFASHDAELVGIASTAGNVPVQQVCQNNLGLLELCGVADVPVSKGSEQPVSAAAHRRGHPWPAGPGLCRRLPSTDRQLTAHDAAQAWVHAAHDTSRRTGRAGDRAADQPGAGAAAASRRCPSCCAGW